MDHADLQDWPESMPSWERRLRARRVGVPDWAQDAPDRCAVVATTAAGVLEVHSWSPVGGQSPRPLTKRPDGTVDATIDPSGQWIWWFDDQDGDEYGVWRRQPYGSGPGEGVVAASELPAAYSVGLALGPDGLAIVGSSDDDYGTRIHVAAQGDSRLIYEHREAAGVGALSRDGTLVAIEHSEHGDSRHMALRVVRSADGTTVGELWDGPGKGLHAAGFTPVAGDARLLVIHERAGRPGLLIWDPVADPAAAQVRELALETAGEVTDADWYPSGDALLIAVDHHARTRLWRLDLGGELTAVGPATGSVSAAGVRPDGDIWLGWSSAAEPAAVRDGSGGVVLTPPGPLAPPSVPVEDVWVDGPGGRIHALLRRPPGVTAPYPTVFEVHGGPDHHDADAFTGYASAYVDEGYAVVHVNYRGSTGYGSAWRDALTQRVGHTELADVRAVRDQLVAEGIVDPAHIALSGASWGGFVSLLGLGAQPDAWTVGVASVPVADYVAAYEDEMDGLKAFDRALFGGSPAEVPERYADSSPISYVAAVRAPLLVLAGENDPRCPIRQIDNYLARLTELDIPHQVYRYDAGHGSMVNDERVLQLRVELDFLRRHLHP